MCKFLNLILKLTLHNISSGIKTNTWEKSLIYVIFINQDEQLPQRIVRALPAVSLEIHAGFHESSVLFLQHL